MQVQDRRRLRPPLALVLILMLVLFLPLAVRAGNALVSGTVRDAAGDPISGITVTCTAGCSEPVTTAISDIRGHYPADDEFRVVFQAAECREVELTASGPGYAPHSVTVTVCQSAEVTQDFYLERGAPEVDAGGPYGGDEGSAISLDATASSVDAMTFAWSYDVVSAAAGTSCAFSDATIENPAFTCSDDGSFSVTLLVDDGYLTNSDSATVSVANVAPVVNAGADDTVSQGATFTGAGSFSDPGADLWMATVNYGDGDGVEALPLTGTTFTLSHVYTAAGGYTVTVCVTDDEGAEGCDSLVVTVTPVHRLYLPVALQNAHPAQP